MKTASGSKIAFISLLCLILFYQIRFDVRLGKDGSLSPASNDIVFHLESNSSQNTSYLINAKADVAVATTKKNDGLTTTSWPAMTPWYDRSNETSFREAWLASHTRKFNQFVPRSTIHNPQEPPLKFLFGIVTTNDQKEKRKAIRDTYLRFYKDMDLASASAWKSNSSFPSSVFPNSDRICSLTQLQSGDVKYEHCQVAYAFVTAGGDPEISPLELVHPNSSFPMTVPGPTTNNDENDIIYLNIRENRDEGKITTWFKYASMIAKEFPFDYIAKVDDDAMIFIDSFLSYSELNLPRRSDNIPLVYGGSGISPYPSCWEEPRSDLPLDHCDLFGPIRMSGPFYFLSPDLAEFIASDIVDRITFQSIEDVAIGSFVWQHPDPNVTVVSIPWDRWLCGYDNAIVWFQPIQYFKGRDKFTNLLFAHTEKGYWPGPFFKDLGNFRKLWREYHAWELSGRTLSLDDRYMLYDLPPTVDSPALRGSSSPPLSSSSRLPGSTTVNINDYIYSNQDFDSIPIVLESPYNLVFFPITGVADVAWRCLFRQISGFSDWQNTTKQFDGLRLLSHYSVDKASVIMSSPNYTRAMFIRNPLDRIQSNYFQIAIKDNFKLIESDCPCVYFDCGPVKQSFWSFLRNMADCDKPYWRPQAKRMEPRYFSTLNFVGRYESLIEDSERLLNRIGAQVTDFRIGGGGLSEFFEQFDVSFNLSSARMQKRLTRRRWEGLFRQVFASDLTSPFFNFTGGS